jgi:hypothetical protein
MELFHVIDDGVAIVKVGSVYKQTKLYRRGDRLFVTHAGGYVRICAKFGDTWGTAMPNIKVIDFEGAGVVNATSEPRFQA